MSETFRVTYSEHQIGRTTRCVVGTHTVHDILRLSGSAEINAMSNEIAANLELARIFEIIGVGQNKPNDKPTKFMVAIIWFSTLRDRVVTRAGIQSVDMDQLKPFFLQAIQEYQPLNTQ